MRRRPWSRLPALSPERLLAQRHTPTQPWGPSVRPACMLRLPASCAPQSSVRLLEFRVSLEVTCMSLLSSSLTFSWGVSTSGLPVPRECLVTVSFCDWCARLCGERSPGRGPGRGLLSRGSSSEPGVSCRARRPLFWSLWARSLQSAPSCVSAGYGTSRSRPLGPCTWPWTPGPGVSVRSASG